MTIQYYLRTLGGGSNAAGTYIAQTRRKGVVDLDGLADAVASRKIAVGHGDVASVLEALCDVIEDELLRGNRVQLGRIARLWATVKGTFDSVSAPYDPQTHTVGVACSAGTQLVRRVGKNAQVRRINYVVHAPQLGQYRNITDDSDSTIRSHSVCQLDGADLNFDVSDATQGLYLLDSVGTLPDVKVQTFARAMPRQIVFQTPDIDGYSQVTLEVRRRQIESAELLTGTYEPLNVTAPLAEAKV